MPVKLQNHSSKTGPSPFLEGQLLLRIQQAGRHGCGVEQNQAGASYICLIPSPRETYGYWKLHWKLDFSAVIELEDTCVGMFVVTSTLAVIKIIGKQPRCHQREGGCG
jgi:hypothetical protein